MNNEFESTLDSMNRSEVNDPETYNDHHNPYRLENNYDPYMYLYKVEKGCSGFRQIETPLLQLLMTGFLGEIEARIFWYIFDLTRGWIDRENGYQCREGLEYESIAQLCKYCMKACKLKTRTEFYRNYKRLSSRKVLYLWEDENRKMISINFNITTWTGSEDNLQRDREAKAKLDTVMRKI